MSSRILVLDANILIRAVLGNKVRDLLIKHSGVVDFITPDICMADAQKYIPILFEKRALPIEPALTIRRRLFFSWLFIDLIDTILMCSWLSPML
jgi:hypothetical protein